MTDKIRLYPKTLLCVERVHTDADGIALTSMAHPGKRHWYDRFVMRFKPRAKLSPESVEQMEIKIRGR
jgi:hypothetical protein